MISAMRRNSSTSVRVYILIYVYSLVATVQCVYVVNKNLQTEAEPQLALLSCILCISGPLT